MKITIPITRCGILEPIVLEEFNGPHPTKKSAVRSAAAKDRSVTAVTGSSTCGKTAIATSPQITPGVVITSGITR
jgi:hypothetical protein